MLTRFPAFTKHVARYPNNAPAHGLLIVDYTELGREEEARAEAAEVIRISPQNSMEVFEKRAPFKDQVFRDRVVSDMRKAGLK